MLEIQDENDFQQLMEEIDAELRHDGLPIQNRQMDGAGRIASRYNLVLPFPKKGYVARQGVYSGQDLANRISDWFKTRYGKRLTFDGCRERTVVLIRGDAYEVRLPMWFGQVNFYCDPADHGKPKEDKTQCNVLNLIDGLEPSYSAQFSCEELEQLHAEITFANIAFYNEIEWLYQLSYGDTVHAEYRSAVSTLMSGDYGLSRFHSLLAVEKVMKATITKAGLVVPRSGRQGHELRRLNELCISVGMIDPGQTLFSFVQCSATVRYNEVKSTLLQAATAHRASILLGDHVAKFAQTLRRGG